jgi:hypothetical protein
VLLPEAASHPWLEISTSKPTCIDTPPNSLLALVGECLRVLFRFEFSAFPARKTGFCLFNHRDDFEAPALALFPQRQRFLNCLFLAGKPAALDGLLHERTLVLNIMRQPRSAL